MKIFTYLFSIIIIYIISNNISITKAQENLLQIPENTPSNTQNLDNSTSEKLTELIIFPVGINLGKRNVLTSTLIRGLEDGTQAINLSNWLIPFDIVIQALQFQVTILADGQLELRSPGSIVRIKPDALTTDPELGLVISLKKIESLLSVPSEFDINEYAIVFSPPWLGIKRKKKVTEEDLIIIEGLPKIEAPHLTLTTAAQEINISGNRSNNTNSQANFALLGTALDSSWFVRVNQPDLNDNRTWRLQEAQLLRQRNQTDYVFGSQPTFWSSETNSQLWGMTTIQRWGFSPPSILGTSSGFNPRQRLQANELKRTISGKAEPGTFVQLIKGFGDEIIAETLVDSSGVYRFENIPTGGRSGANNYNILLYPGGQLTAQPIIRKATFRSVTGQLSHKASALIISAGSSREFSGENEFFGSFSELIGGVGYRYGVSENLTLGAGIIYDRSARVLGEAFYQPGNLPLQVAISALTNPSYELEIASSLNWQPFNNLSFNFNSDRFSERFNLSWRVLRNLSIFVDGNSRNDQISAGIQASTGGRSYQISTRVVSNTDNQWRWNFNSRFYRFKFGSFGNEFGSNYRLTYNLSSEKTRAINLDIGHVIFANFDINYRSDLSDNLTTIGWRYRSPIQLSDGRYIWDLEVGYGFGSQGNGFVATASTAIIPGLVLRTRYQQVSPTSNTDSFRIEVSPLLNFQQGLHPDDPNFDYLRQQGGLLIQPFFDQNNNGKKDLGEKSYLEDVDLLLVINNRSLTTFRRYTRRDGIYVRLSPNTYRLDLDPAGFPLDWRAIQLAYAVEVVAGSYTPVLIPLVLSYTISGIVTDDQNKPLGGARVEAVPTKKGLTITSVTNDGGVFYLEGLSQGTYQLLINNEPAQPSTITINKNTESFQELNLQSPK